jgi:tetratricopeptide (TPR) repeat protein
MSTKASSSADARNDIATLLKESTALLSSRESTIELSRRLDPSAIGTVERVVQETIASGALDSADSMLMMTERAARLAGLDAIRYWARVGRGMIAVRRQNDTRAGSLLAEGFEYLDERGASGDAALLRAYYAAGDWLCDRALREKKLPEARELLARMLRHTSAADLQARIIIKLLWLSLSIGDLASAEAHALRLIDGSAWEAGAGDDTFENTLLTLLRTTASRLYEAGEARYESARQIARAVVNKAGQDGPMLLVLALVAFTLEDFVDALVSLDRLLEAPQELLPGYDVTRLYHRRTLCLLQLKRNEEAVESIQRAVQGAPRDPYVRFAAAQMFEALGDPNRTIEEYAETIRLCEERMASAVPGAEPRAKPLSMKEYESSTPVEDLRDFAIIRRSLCLRRAGSNAEAVAGLEALVSVGDETSRGQALETLAEWAEADGRLKDAAELLARARSPHSAPNDEIDARLARVLIGLGAFDQAVDVLVPLCHKSRQPEKCVELLDRIPRSWSGFARVRKWRGYAKTEAGWPREGVADLDAAVEANPADADALFLRALARITFGVKPGQEDWNRSRAMRHIRESLDDLYAALRLNPDHAEARRVCKWLVERAAANPEMYEIFSAGGTRDGDLFTVFPDLRPAFEMAWRANDLGFKREFSRCALAWSEAMHAYERAGFEILAARVNLRLADVYLRLLRLDQAATHLERAEQLRFLVDVPLSRDVLDQYNDLAARRGPYERPTLGREVEYVWIYDHAAYEELKLAFVKANYRHRLGDVEGALECVDLLGPVLAELPANLGSVFGIEEVLWVIGILRDGGRYDDALRLLDSLQTHAAETRRSFDVLYMRGLLHDVKGEPHLAIEAYEQAFAVSEERSRPVGVAPYVQYAASLLHAGREADALQALTGIDIEDAAGSDRDRLMYYTVAAWVYGTRLAYPEALNAVEKAIAIVEERRVEIPDPTSRRAWQGQHESLFSIAVKLYADTGQPRQAWRAVELSKARTLLDELEGRQTLSPEYGVLVGDLETIERATRIVEREISRDAMGDAVAALRTEALAELAQLLEPRFQEILASTSFKDQNFPAMRDMLLERRNIVADKERRMRDASSLRAGAVIGLDEVARLLED